VKETAAVAQTVEQAALVAHPQPVDEIELLLAVVIEINSFHGLEGNFLIGGFFRDKIAQQPEQVFDSFRLRKAPVSLNRAGQSSREQEGQEEIEAWRASNVDPAAIADVKEASISPPAKGEKFRAKNDLEREGEIHLFAPFAARENSHEGRIKSIPHPLPDTDTSVWEMISLTVSSTPLRCFMLVSEPQ